MFNIYIKETQIFEKRCHFFLLDFSFQECKSLSHIRAHCLIHTDIKPFTCLKCSYRTNSSGSLYFHMRKHTGNVFWCSSCDFKCMKRSHLLDHEVNMKIISYQLFLETLFIFFFFTLLNELSPHCHIKVVIKQTKKSVVEL